MWVDRRGVHPSPVLWQPADGGDPAATGLAGEPQAGAAPIALDGLGGMAPGPSTTVRHPGHQVYLYLLRGMVVVRSNHVWSTDITFIRLTRGFAYLVAVIDW